MGIDIGVGNLFTPFMQYDLEMLKSVEDRKSEEFACSIQKEKGSAPHFRLLAYPYRARPVQAQKGKSSAMITGSRISSTPASRTSAGRSARHHRGS